MKFYSYFFILLFKLIISDWDVTFGIKALFFKRFLGSMGSELIVFRVRDKFMLF